MNRFTFFVSLLAGSLLMACSASNTPVEDGKQDDPGANELTGPVASEIENGQQFATSDGAGVLATLMSTEIFNLLNTLNLTVTSGTTQGNAAAENCLAEFDAGLGKPVAEFSCDVEFELSATAAIEFSGQVLVTEYCEAALAKQQAQNCAIQDGTIALPLEWVADATGTPAPLLATTVIYRHANTTLIVTTPEQIGIDASSCAYDMVNSGQTNAATAAECSERLLEVTKRLDDG